MYVSAAACFTHMSMSKVCTLTNYPYLFFTSTPHSRYDIEGSTKRTLTEDEGLTLPPPLPPALPCDSESCLEESVTYCMTCVMKLCKEHKQVSDSSQ